MGVGGEGIIGGIEGIGMRGVGLMIGGGIGIHMLRVILMRCKLGILILRIIIKVALGRGGLIVGDRAVRGQVVGERIEGPEGMTEEKIEETVVGLGERIIEIQGEMTIETQEEMIEETTGEMIGERIEEEMIEDQEEMTEVREEMINAMIEEEKTEDVKETMKKKITEIIEIIAIAEETEINRQFIVSKHILQ